MRATGIALLLCLLHPPTAGALRIDFTELPPVATGDVRIFSVDLETGTVRFGDGVQGAVPPVGRRPIIATYDVGAGAIGNVVPIAGDISADSPLLIPIDEFPVSNPDEPEISFILFGSKRWNLRSRSTALASPRSDRSPGPLRSRSLASAPSVFSAWPGDGAAPD